MSAIAEEDDMVVEDRVAKLESDVGHLRSDLGEMKLDLREVKLDLKSLRTEVSVFKTEVAAEFGRVRTAIERTKVWMLVTGLATILSVFGSALALGRMLKG